MEPEDEGRLQLYALLARLFAAGPDEGLLRALSQSAGSVEGDGALAQAFNDLAQAASHTSARDATLEFDTTFIGVGKAPVSTYLSHYHPGTRKEAVLVKLRDTLTELGLARTAASAEPEDNLTAVLEVMRHLVAAGSDEQSLQRQREFFARYLHPSIPCDFVTRRTRPTSATTTRQQLTCSRCFSSPIWLSSRWARCCAGDRALTAR